MREQAIRRLNALRAKGASCGRQAMPAVPPVAWNETLFSVAAKHSGDMARRNYFDHVTPEGVRIAQRATAEGYPWRAIAENIAGGDDDVESVVEGWTRSAGHCRAMMDPAYSEAGLACVQRSGTKWGTYWTLVLGKKR